MIVRFSFALGVSDAGLIPPPDSGPDEPITQPTNRGNKLRANAKYVHEGVLGYTNPQELYKEVC